MSPTSRRALAIVLVLGCTHEASTPTGAIALVADRCSDPVCASQPQTVPVSDTIALGPLVVATYDGSGQAVHPDVAITPEGWGTSRLHLALTPYPYGDQSFENPSLYASADAATWIAEPGIANPIARSSPETGYLSDPALVYVPERRELWMYYRRVKLVNDVLLVRSGDGVHWSEPTPVASAPNHLLISPTVVHRSAGEWAMWSVAANDGCISVRTTVERRTSRNGFAWSPPRQVDLPVPAGLMAWHIHVMWVPTEGRYWALYNAKEGTNCATRALYLATSEDGLSWTSYPAPLLSAGDLPVFSTIVYRSCMVYDAARDRVWFWLSGAGPDALGQLSWRIAALSLPRTAVLERVSRAAPAYRPAPPSRRYPGFVEGGDLRRKLP